MECKTSKTMPELVEGENNNEKKSSWSDLLPELSSLILSRLFMGDFVTFHATCKSWQSIPSISRPLLPLSPDDLLAQHPYLMFRNTRTKLFNFYHPILNSSYQVEIPEIYNCDIRFSKDNWLIMSRSEYDLFFFNPLTKAKIELPDIPFDYVFSRVCFSSNPTASDCVVYGFGHGMGQMKVCTWKKGERDWRTYEYHSDPSFLLASCSPVVCNGLVYCLCEEGDLGILDPTISDPSWVMGVKPSERFGNSERHFLVGSEGDLFSVLIAPDWIEVDVLRLDSETMSWIDVESLGDKMLFVSLKSSFCLKALVNGSGNKVYFSRFNGNDGVFYSLKTKKFHGVSGSVGSISGSLQAAVKEIKQSTWIKMCS